MLMTIMDGLMKLEERYDFVMKKKKKKEKSIIRPKVKSFSTYSVLYMYPSFADKNSDSGL